MPITFNLKHQDIANKMLMPIEEVDRRCITALRRAMMEAVKYAKGLNTYTDRTGNLRSSILFNTFKEGVLVDSYSFGNTQGIEKGNETAKNRLDLSNKRIYSVIVAGMHYAAYVEAKGFDVLTGAELRLKEIAKPYLKEAFKDTNIIITGM